MKSLWAIILLILSAVLVVYALVAPKLDKGIKSAMPKVSEQTLRKRRIVGIPIFIGGILLAGLKVISSDTLLYGLLAAAVLLSILFPDSK